MLNLHNIKAWFWDRRENKTDCATERRHPKNSREATERIFNALEDLEKTVSVNGFHKEKK